MAPTCEPLPTTGSGWSGEQTRPVRWAEVTARLRRGGWYWLSTARPDGAPHTVPVLGAWSDPVLFIAMKDTSRKSRNLAAQPRCTISHDAGDLHVVVEGHAERVRGDTLTAASTAFAQVHGWPTTVRDGRLDADHGAPTSGGPPYDAVALTPMQAFAFPVDETKFAPTRFRFG